MPTNAERGEEIFFERADVSCARCHQVDGKGGQVGPDLSTLAGKQPREYVLESIVQPNKKITEGFATESLLLADGLQVTGILKAENDDELQLVTPEGKTLTIAQEDVEDRVTTSSAMPEGLAQQLSKSDLRDLIEFLSQPSEVRVSAAVTGLTPSTR